MVTLKRKLFDEYGGFADQRIQNLDKGERFIIDDREPRDVGANHKLYSYFCEIYADVISEANLVSKDRIRVVLHGNIPSSQGVQAWIEEHIPASGDSFASSLIFIIEKDQEFILNELADCIEAIVAPGVPHYKTASYKYVCPRTANSLRRFAKILSEYWN
jgi:hypothetical protein